MDNNTCPTGGKKGSDLTPWFKIKIDLLTWLTEIDLIQWLEEIDLFQRSQIDRRHCDLFLSTRSKASISDGNKPSWLGLACKLSQPDLGLAWLELEILSLLHKLACFLDF